MVTFSKLEQDHSLRIFSRPEVDDGMISYFRWTSRGPCSDLVVHKPGHPNDGERIRFKVVGRADRSNLVFSEYGQVFADNPPVTALRRFYLAEPDVSTAVDYFDNMVSTLYRVLEQSAIRNTIITTTEDNKDAVVLTQRVWV